MNFNIFFRKINIFWGMKILWIFFGAITKLDYNFMHFRVSSSGQGTESGIYFWVEKFQIFFGVLEIPDIFG